MEMIKTKTWLVIADEAGARIYVLHKDKNTLEKLEDIAHPEGREATQEYLDFQRGNYNAGNITGSFSPHTDLKEAEDNRFAIHLAKHLEAHLAHHNFDELIVAASPRFHGMFTKHATEQLNKKTAQNIMKDYMHLSEKELAEKIFV